MTDRPGFGLPHPAFHELLQRRRPAVVEPVSWRDGLVRFDVAVHLSPMDEVPVELVSSARCIVRHAGRVVVCTDADGGSHVLPGGRLEPGESVTAAAAREVHEETGWRVDPASLVVVGWLHFAYRTQVDEFFRQYPHPDFVHAVFTAEGVERDGAQGGEWTDTEGYVIASRLADVDEARAVVADLALDRTLLEEAIARSR